MGNRIPDLVCDSCSRCSCTKHDESCLVPFHSIDVKRRHHRGECHTSRALDIVVKTSELWRILVKDSSCVVEPEILKMNVCPRIRLATGLDESVNKGIVSVSSDTSMFEPEIEVIFAQFRVLGFDISTNRYRAFFFVKE